MTHVQEERFERIARVCRSALAERAGQPINMADVLLCVWLQLPEISEAEVAQVLQALQRCQHRKKAPPPK